MTGPLDPPQPGARSISRGRTITEADVAQFAALTGDMHPQHTDAVWAAGSRFGERVAHGMLVLSYCVGLVEFDPERVVALRRVSNAVFKRPVALGDTIHVESAVQAVDPLDGGHSLVACGWRVLNQDGLLVARATLELVWRAEAGVGAAADPRPVDDDFVPIPL
ncbi:MAG: MaoC family dehydratase N-terminal domain-containing protein [Actinomycetota bacterium]|nr:MaoC family dehydratase N-terminal domain-containing protein [Actinomycetota bacterium]